MSDHKTVTVTVDNVSHVINDVYCVDITDNGTLVIYGFTKGVIRALGPGEWSEVSVSGNRNE